MRVAIASTLILGFLSACGSDSSGTGSGAGGTSSGGSAGAGGSSATGGVAGGATGGVAGSSGSGGSAGSSGPTACGPSLVCAQYSVCIVDEIAPACTPKTGNTCPSGQTESQCGGIGTPCCCEPTPPPEYRCEGKGICGATPDCTCLGTTICHDGQMCSAISGKAWEFHCADPPQA